MQLVRLARIALQDCISKIESVKSYENSESVPLSPDSVKALENFIYEKVKIQEEDLGLEIQHVNFRE